MAKLNKYTVHIRALKITELLETLMRDLALTEHRFKINRALVQETLADLNWGNMGLRRALRSIEKMVTWRDLQGDNNAVEKVLPHQASPKIQGKKKGSEGQTSLFGLPPATDPLRRGKR